MEGAAIHQENLLTFGLLKICSERKLDPIKDPIGHEPRHTAEQPQGHPIHGRHHIAGPRARARQRVKDRVRRHLRASVRVSGGVDTGRDAATIL
jgi:hypothetical protein